MGVVFSGTKVTGVFESVCRAAVSLLPTILDRNIRTTWGIGIYTTTVLTCSPNVVCFVGTPVSVCETV